jgi:alpha-L-rhamnosidase
MPYEADAYIQQISHYAADREFAIQRYTNAFLIYNPSWPTEWHLHIVLMAWADYMATGDDRFLEKVLR